MLAQMLDPYIGNALSLTSQPSHNLSMRAYSLTLRLLIRKIVQQLPNICLNHPITNITIQHNSITCPFSGAIAKALCKIKLSL